jgi:peptidoglycan/LPS O-acetylase OafA/YrhL
VTLEPGPAVDGPLKTSKTVAGIQALRAFSVTWVVIGHAAPGWLPGGFIGVDVFFVISGFLITSHLMNQFEGSRFSFGSFYLRRAQRLLPAALTVLAVTAVASILLVPPAWEQSTLMGIAAAAAYVVNWWLAESAVNYFADAGIVSPVNHYWSLSVEEQFYFAWPVLMWLGWRVATVARRRNWRIGFSGIVGIELLMVVALSFGAAIEVMSRDSSAGYFVTQGRAWEFAIGGLAHLGLRKGLFRIPGWTRPVLLLGGWAILASSGVLLGPNSSVPGFAAVSPVLAAAVLLLIGDDHRWRSAGRIIEWPSVQLLGDLSYSIYLWHWPFLVLAPFALKTEHLSAVQITSVLLCTLVASLVTQRQLENRFRRPAGDTRPLRKLAVYAVLSLSVAGLAVGLAGRQESRADDIANELYELSIEQPPCFGARATEAGAICPRSHELADPDYMLQNWSTQINQLSNGNSCQNPPGEAAPAPCSFGASADSAERGVALFGDSHAGMWAAALDQFAERRQIRVTSYVASSCVATDDVTSFANYLHPDNRQACIDWRAAATQEILDNPLIDTVVVSGHVTGQALLRDQGWVEDDGTGYASLWLRLLDSGKRVVVIEDVPMLPFFLPDCLARTPSVDDPCTHPASAVGDFTAFTRALAMLDPDSVDYISTTDVFCGAETCHTVIGGVPVYMDSDHISAPFARSLAPRLEAVIAP